MNLQYDKSISCLDDSFSCFKKWCLAPLGKWETYCTNIICSEALKSYFKCTTKFKFHFLFHIQNQKKTGFEWIGALLSPNSISCWSFQHRKTNQEMELMTCCSSKTMIISGGKSKTDSIAWALLQVYHQNEIPFPLSQLKTEKLVLHEFKHYFLKISFHVVLFKIGRQNRKWN